MLEYGPTTEQKPRLMPSGGISPALRVVGYLVVVFIGMVVAGGIGGVIAAIFGLVDVFKHGNISSPPLALVTIMQSMVTAASVLVTYLFVTLVDRRPWTTVGFDRRGSWLTEVLIGLILGVMMVDVMFLVSYVAGWSHVTGTLFAGGSRTTVGVLIETLILFIAIGVNEEVIMRGYVLQTLKRGYGPAAALIVSSIIFGSMHFMNPGASFAGFLGTSAAGFLLGYAYLATGRLWMPIALHFSWNFAEGAMFGFPVSGINIQGWVQQSLHGPVIWTGGRFGPEAGLLCPIVLAIGWVFIWWWARKSKAGVMKKSDAGY